MWGDEMLQRVLKAQDILSGVTCVSRSNNDFGSGVESFTIYT